MNSFQAEISALRSEVWQLQTDLSAEKANKKALEAKLSELRLKLDNSKASYERELESSREQLTASQTQLEDLHRKFVAVSETHDDLSKKVRQLEFEVESKTHEIRDLREHCNGLDKTLKQRHLEIERLIAKTGDLDKELAVRRTATDVNGELSELLLNKDNHIHELEVKLGEAAEGAAALKSEAAFLKDKLEALEEARKTAANETKKLQNEVEREAKREREVAEEKNKSLNKEITRLTMLLSQTNVRSEGGVSGVDTDLLNRLRVLESENDEVCPPPSKSPLVPHSPTNTRVVRCPGSTGPPAPPWKRNKKN